MKRLRVTLAFSLLCLQRAKQLAQQESLRTEEASWVEADSLLRQLEMMCDSLGKLPPEIKAQYPHIRWKDIAGFRIILAHLYMDLDWRPVWQVVDEDLPIVERMLEELLDEHGGPLALV